jgi:murein L,D-transpeptidase YafK
MRGSMIALVLMIALGLGATFGVARDAAADLPKADKLVVYKAKRTMHLMRKGWVIRTYAIRLGDKPVGPKMFENDGRTPEGLYLIDGRNAASRFHRSLRISYPGPKDLARAARYETSAGGEIFIHGTPGSGGKYETDWTNGCIAVSNREIEELWRTVDDGTPIEIKP